MPTVKLVLEDLSAEEVAKVMAAIQPAPVDVPRETSDSVEPAPTAEPELVPAA